VDIRADVELTPRQVAEAFWALDSEQQASFFAELDRIAGLKLCFQMAWVVRSIIERNDSGDHDAMNGFQTMLAHAQDFAESAASIRAGKAKANISRMAQQARRPQ
jgi:hypothetical protein